MSNDELLDLVNEDDRVIGTVWKSEAHSDVTKIHREIAIAVFNKSGEVLIQQRSLNKANDPGVWKISAAGHPEAGEDPKVAAERELFEELGIKTDARFYKKIFSERKGLPGHQESRFVYIYYGFAIGNSKPTLQKSEVMDAKWINPDKLANFSKKHSWDLKGISHKIIMELKSIVKA